MPSFDVVSEVDKHELQNAVDQASRELTTRFDFKGVNASFSLKENTITLAAPDDFQVQQMRDILENKLVKRNIDLQSLDIKEMNKNLSEARQEITVRQGIEQEFAKKIVKLLKETKIKVQAQIQGEQVRISGKKRDDLQEAIAFLRQAEVGIPLQYTNFRD